MTERRQQELDAQVEALARQLATVINGAGSGQRQDLREYALGLIRDETEIVDATPGAAQTSTPNGGGPLATALLLALAALPLLLLFAPVGLLLLGMAALMALWGVVVPAVRPRLRRAG